ncbi:hypothetical protein BaRGS_00020699 [Batillaria attramentaria]|uniref:Secreted protein n=1 Tax=Batillaria attramentaria TaxID=370345 RepID=A0ABD0KLJ2_9CAEN
MTPAEGHQSRCSQTEALSGGRRFSAAVVLLLLGAVHQCVFLCPPKLRGGNVLFEGFAMGLRFDSIIVAIRSNITFVWPV